MDRTHSELWQRIETFAIDPAGATLTFADRLARENGWSRGYARRVADEYKRFVFLAMVAGHEVTPSDEVDEAWHLHLTYTRSYWDDLCRNVLGKPLHHIPTRGGPSERSRHVEQYNRTLASYEEYFGHVPPADIWPPAEARFSKDKHHVRINRGHVWLIPKPRWPRKLVRGSSLVFGAVAAPMLLGITNPLDMDGPEFLKFYAVVCVFGIIVAAALRHFLRSDEPVTDQRPLTPYEIACLGTGIPGVLRACLATLIIDKRLRFNPDEKMTPFKALVSPDTAPSEIERIMLRGADHENGTTAGALLDAARPEAEKIQSGLQARGLMESASSFAAARWGPMLVLVPILLLGMAKIFVGISRDKPVVFLIIGVIVLALVIALYFLKVPLRTRKGEERLRELKAQHERLKSLDLGSPSREPMMPLASSDVLLAAGLFGLASLHHPDVTALNQSLKPISETSHSSSGCGASTGCGGGGDGGGCGGGCGGCGGD